MTIVPPVTASCDDRALFGRQRRGAASDCLPCPERQRRRRRSSRISPRTASDSAAAVNARHFSRLETPIVDVVGERRRNAFAADGTAE